MVDQSQECTYGLVKRLRFVEEFITEQGPKSVLDIGCGTGNNLTVPLARRFPEVRFVGADADPTSIEFARTHNAAANLEFRLTEELAADERFDLIIASEVIEHVEEPKRFLEFLNGRLAPGGRIVLTLPNGYGPFEFGSFVQTVLDLAGLLRILQRIKHALVGRRASPSDAGGADAAAGDAAAAAGHDTLALSPHLNYFSFSTIRRLIESAALRVERYRPRTFLCGFGFDQTLRWKLPGWNAKVADYLPARLNSGWMFVLRNGGETSEFDYRRGPYARLRRYLNRKRYGVG